MPSFACANSSVPDHGMTAASASESSPCSAGGVPFITQSLKAIAFW
jgi:hypothetical protein